jgi:hypothetical protein
VNHEITQANGLVAAVARTYRLLKRFAMKNVDERVAAVQPLRLIRHAVHSGPLPEVR